MINNLFNEKFYTLHIFDLTINVFANLHTQILIILRPPDFSIDLVNPFRVTPSLKYFSQWKHSIVSDGVRHWNLTLIHAQYSMAIVNIERNLIVVVNIFQINLLIYYIVLLITIKIIYPGTSRWNGVFQPRCYYRRFLIFSTSTMNTEEIINPFRTRRT